MKEKIEENYLNLLSHRECVLFALFCAKQVEQTLSEAIEAIEVIERWLDGKASEEECGVTAEAVHKAAFLAHITYADYAAARAASNAIFTIINLNKAYYATTAAHYTIHATHIVSQSLVEKVIEEQWRYYNELLHFDDIAHNILLGDDTDTII